VPSEEEVKTYIRRTRTKQAVDKSYEVATEEECRY
jgi:hypothetical protein